jgi:hypothetical protein
VPHLAGKSPGAAQQLPADDDAAADADLTGQVDEIGGARLGPHRPLGDRRQVGVVLHPDRAGQAHPGAQVLDHRHVVPADVRRVHDHAVDAEHQAGHGQGQPDRGGLPRRGRRGGLLHQAGDLVQRPVGPERGDVERHPVLEEDLATQVQDQRGRVVDVQLDADAAHRATVQMHDQTGSSDRARAVDLAGADQPAVGELGDQAGDRRLVQAGLLGDTGARARTGVAQVPQHQAQVAAPDRRLVGGRVPRGSRLAVQSPSLEHVAPTSPRPHRCDHLVGRIDKLWRRPDAVKLAGCRYSTATWWDRAHRSDEIGAAWLLSAPMTSSPIPTVVRR